ncbi:MAG: hypothetical protein JKY65_32820 [Planctomycetes bacterium]|nr:hypothetical protein [Planctomycetota bacterium]
MPDSNDSPPHLGEPAAPPRIFGRLVPCAVVLALLVLGSLGLYAVLQQKPREARVSHSAAGYRLEVDGYLPMDLLLGPECRDPVAQMAGIHCRLNWVGRGEEREILFLVGEDSIRLGTSLLHPGDAEAVLLLPSGSAEVVGRGFPIELEVWEARSQAGRVSTHVYSHESPRNVFTSVEVLLDGLPRGHRSERSFSLDLKGWDYRDRIGGEIAWVRYDADQDTVEYSLTRKGRSVGAGAMKLSSSSNLKERMGSLSPVTSEGGR